MSPVRVQAARYRDPTRLSSRRRLTLTDEVTHERADMHTVYGQDEPSLKAVPLVSVTTERVAGTLAVHA